MPDKEEKKRCEAIQQYLSGKRPVDIWISLRRSERWFYKWLERFKTGETDWYKDQSRCPNNSPDRTPDEIEAIVKMVRLELYNQGIFCGAQAIYWELEKLDVTPKPSIRTIARILARNDLTHKRTGRYEPKGKKYPKLEATKPNDVHQSDFVGPCYIRGPIRFYNFNSVDLATGRCAIETMTEGKKDIIDALWSTWLRLGLPRYQQIDNDASFYGSPSHPRGMGKLIRICLHNGIEPCFIPVREPWRNGIVEKFNDNWQTNFFQRKVFETKESLIEGNQFFEQHHNSKYRYSKLGGKTPLEYLSKANVELCFPLNSEPPKEPLEKPESGRYHVFRFIRSDGKLDVFGEKFMMPPEAVYEYVKATIDVEKQKLYVYLDNVLIDEINYKLR